jgi:hypothetical protein
MENLSSRWRPVYLDWSHSDFGASAVDATAFFGYVGRCGNGMKMERQKKNRQEQ